jgi:glycosyltransferase involved in cell wall biosynthesis
MRVGIDATPLLGSRSGVGRYVEGLLGGLREIGSPVDVVLTTFSLRGAKPPAADLVGASLARRRLPARALQPAWARTELPPVEILTGGLHVFHGTNFVQPPSRSAGVLTIHDLAFLHHATTVTPAVLKYRDLVPRSIRRSETIICFTQAIADEISDAYQVAPDRIRVIPHGVDSSWGNAAPLTGAELGQLGVSERYLLAVGTLEPRKNLGLLIRAHAAARAAQPQAVPRLVLVGGAGWGDRWDDAVPDPKNVTIVGFVGDSHLKALVAGADALCMPSKYEGFGLPILEALAAGRPVLASDIPAHREVGGSLVRFLPFSVDEWSQAMLEASPAEDQKARDERRTYAGQFTWRRSALLHVATYREARAAAAERRA